MAAIAKTSLSLRIAGDVLDPVRVSEMLKCKPDKGYTKGSEIRRSKGDLPRIAKTGICWFRVEDRSPGDLDGQLQELFSKLNDDPDVWFQLQSDFSLDLFCGVFLDGMNEGFTLESSTIRMIGERGLEIGFDIYSGSPHPDPT